MGGYVETNGIGLRANPSLVARRHRMRKPADFLRSSIEVKEAIISSDSLCSKVEQAAEAIVDACRNGGKVLFCGNGGSAADAQHLAAELSGRFLFDRPPLDAEALHCNSSHLTAVANDYSFDEIFARLVKARGRDGDILVGLSTSGSSPNIVHALQEARALRMKTVGFTGSKDGTMDPLCDILLKVPSTFTPHIQEAHITLGHYICEAVELQLFG